GPTHGGGGSPRVPAGVRSQGHARRSARPGADPRRHARRRGRVDATASRPDQSPRSGPTAAHARELSHTIVGVEVSTTAAMLEALAQVAPGRPLREGIDRILQAGMGALIVVGDGPEVLNICSGGFLLDAEFSPQRLSELAKMDGAII